MAATLRVVKTTKAAGREREFEVALIDTSDGLRRIQALVEELNADPASGGGFRATTIRNALIDGIKQEVECLLDAVGEHVEIRELEEDTR